MWRSNWTFYITIGTQNSSFAIIGFEFHRKDNDDVIFVLYPLQHHRPVFDRWPSGYL
jgi:hypothetical protein